MEKLTFKKSLELCKELWTWLRDNPNVVTKQSWPKWEKYTKVYNFCFACEYDMLEYEKQFKKGYTYSVCHFCTLKDLWGTNCTKKNSPFARWANAVTDKTRQKNADIIVDFCDKELEKIKKKRKI